jgi:hypothetical protein
MISSPCSAASRRYFSVSSTCPGGGSSILQAGWDGELQEVALGLETQAVRDVARQPEERAGFS